MVQLYSTAVMAAEKSNNPILPDVWEIGVGLVAFLILLFIVQKTVAPKFEALYAQRTEAIEGGIEKAKAAQEEAKAALEQYRAQLAEARTEAAKIRDDARAEGQAIVDEMRANAQAESDRIIAAGQSQLATQKAQIVAELRADLGRLSVDLASKVVGESLEDETRKRGTVDRFLNELDAVSAPAGK
ncbi:F0F1 ATP synthase subunit B [Pseudonocardiaceae bacterium YIM PH 21723]|nr:F0F1 ATP synthase subunit B [Pseudonocardiaceae bacterium YIM PH 21723]